MLKWVEEELNEANFKDKRLKARLQTMVEIMANCLKHRSLKPWAPGLRPKAAYRFADILELFA